MKFNRLWIDLLKIFLPSSIHLSDYPQRKTETFYKQKQQQRQLQLYNYNNTFHLYQENFQFHFSFSNSFLVFHSPGCFSSVGRQPLLLLCMRVGHGRVG
jgi:hypothetical protein